MNRPLGLTLLGSQAEFTRLSNTSPFSIDKVNQMNWSCGHVKKKKSSTDCVINSFVVFFLSGHEQPDVWDVRGSSRTSGQDYRSRRRFEAVHQQTVLFLHYRGALRIDPAAGKDLQPYPLKLFDTEQMTRPSKCCCVWKKWPDGIDKKWSYSFISFSIKQCYGYSRSAHRKLLESLEVSF